MSKSLLFDCDPIDQPAAMEPVERLTWCALRVRIGQRVASRIWDESLQSERTNLYLPAFPIVEWIVENWWSLLHELCSWDQVPRFATSEPRLKWIKRHCLRAADSSLLLPALYIFHDGLSLRAEWHSDPPGLLSNMPGEFIAEGAEQIDENATRQSLANFINDTLDRVGQLREDRARDIQLHWRAIQSADAEEQMFCIVAGRMGIDPYNRSEMSEEVAEFLERTITIPEDPLLRDLTEVARCESIVQQWSWLTQASEDLGLARNPVDLSFELPTRGTSPPQFGFQLARKIRALANISSDAPLDSVEAAAESITGKRLRIENRNHAPGSGIRAIVGQSAGDIVAAGPLPERPDSRRFLIARSLYHALVTTKTSRRLVSDAFSWDQKASRAFAAELLAPRQALVDSISTSASGANSDAIESLSHKFKTSTIVIENQLENAGIGLSSE